jgi:hypothetical protein
MINDIRRMKATRRIDGRPIFVSFIDVRLKLGKLWVNDDVIDCCLLFGVLSFWLFLNVLSCDWSLVIG